MSENKSKNSIDKVKCEVNTCYYYVPGNGCCAENIEIKPRNADNIEQTDCATFIRHN